MRRSTQIAIVLGGYLGAVLAALGATAIRIAVTSGPDAVASSGMYAGGDMFSFLGVFGAVALVPTGAALRFLRDRPWFGPALGASAGAIAITGVAAAWGYLVFAPRDAPLGAVIVSTLAVLRLLGSPLMAGALALVALVAPTRGSRRAGWIALAIEVGVCAFAGFRFLIEPRL
ncbi:MAG: hypothetical protein U0610_12050 [bacterium]